MAKKNKDGKYVLAAGEVGSYIVCPEAWRLKMVNKIEVESTPSSHDGMKEHDKWAAKYEDAEYFTKSARLFVLALILVVLLYILNRI